MQIKTVTAILALSFVCFVTAAPIQDATPVQPTTTTTTNHGENDDAAAAEAATVAHEHEHEHGHEHGHDEPDTIEHFDSPFDLLLEKAKANGVTIQLVPGKGRGLVATRDLPAGTRILEESHALYSMMDDPDELLQQYDSADETTQFEIARLHGGDAGASTIMTRERIADIYNQNGFRAGVFLAISRINHACVPLAEYHWHHTLEKGTVHLVRDVQKGEEITICYGDFDHLSAAQRQAQNNYRGFTCQCVACTTNKLASDRRRERLNTLDNVHDMDGYCVAPRARYEYVKLLIEEGLVGGQLGLMYRRMSEFAQNLHHSQEAFKWAKLACENDIKCKGAVDPELDRWRFALDKKVTRLEEQERAKLAAERRLFPLLEQVEAAEEPQQPKELTRQQKKNRKAREKRRLNGQD